MNTTRTPGPWTLTDEPDPLVAGANGDYVAQVFAYEDGSRLRDHYAGDAALIAAAPDLLAALQHALERFECIPEHRDEMGIFRNAARIARRAIAKATGE